MNRVFLVGMEQLAAFLRAEREGIPVDTHHVATGHSVAAEQVAAHLRGELMAGTWNGLMPGGDKLANGFEYEARLPSRGLPGKRIWQACGKCC